MGTWMCEREGNEGGEKGRGGRIDMVSDCELESTVLVFLREPKRTRSIYLSLPEAFEKNSCECTTPSRIVHLQVLKGFSLFQYFEHLFKFKVNFLLFQWEEGHNMKAEKQYRRRFF
uniref:Uncharacterized protein n=1 Tax=Palpitomonas bilix TaxID=652834 RepID=A0A7S3GCA3_9EUKA|mmetsp:Transcript_42004/g.108125  ORF Transcript_42004/g.108125 Transcript_42004/m.108125 type:complete len:116 (+) Transcript_42004:170-517(+)